MPGRRNAAPGSSPESLSSGSRVGPGRSVAAALHVNQRTLQRALGAIWVIDGLLKFQPDLFKSSFVSDVISPMAAGQPSLVASTINQTATLLSHGTTVWVTLFGLIEVAIGVALFFRRTVKQALVASFVWGAGVYLFGEGFGRVLTGQTSPLQGAPGAVCFYLLLGVLVWPKSDRADDRVRVGAESSAAGHGPLGGTGSLLAWAAIWLFQAIIWLFPSNRTANSITDQLTDTANGEPGWYAHFLTSTGHAFDRLGNLDGGDPGHRLGDHRTRTARVQASRDLHRPRDRPGIALLGHGGRLGGAADLRRHRPEQRTDRRPHRTVSLALGARTRRCNRRRRRGSWPRTRWAHWARCWP